MSFVLQPDGTGQERLSQRHTFPLEWVEKNGSVTLVELSNDMNMPLEYSGRLSADKKTLHLFQSRPTNIMLRLTMKKSQVNYVLKKRSS